MIFIEKLLIEFDVSSKKGKFGKREKEFEHQHKEVIFINAWSVQVFPAECFVVAHSNLLTC